MTTPQTDPLVRLTPQMQALIKMGQRALDLKVTLSGGRPIVTSASGFRSASADDVVEHIVGAS